MSKILAIQNRNNKIYALLSELDKEKTLTTKHRSIMDAIAFYIDELEQGAKLVFVGYSFTYDEKLYFRHCLYKNGLKKDIQLIDFNEAFAHYCIKHYEGDMSRGYKDTEYIALHDIDDKLCLVRVKISQGRQIIKADTSDECIDNFENVDFYDESSIYIDEAISLKLEANTYAVIYAGERYKDRFRNKFFNSSSIIKNKDIIINEDIFILGATYYMFEKDNCCSLINTRFKSSIKLTMIAVSADVDTEIELVGKNTHYYDMPFEVEVIAHTSEFLELYYRDIENRLEKIYKIYIGHLIKGVSKPTRLRINVEFLDTNTLIVCIEDIGFGFFVEASRMRVTRYIQFGQDEVI